ncbi:PAS domain-containing sensor histidine kinase, partial [Alsobacter soli]
APEPPPAFARAPDAQPPAAVDAPALRARFGGRPLARFTWRSDPHGRLEDISEDFTRAVGPENTPACGEDMGALAARGVQAREGALAAALLARQTFTGVDLTWPVQGAAGGVAVSLSGVPTFDRGRAFTGYRGFGVIHLDELVPLPAAPSATVEAESRREEAEQAEDEAAPVSEPPFPPRTAPPARDIISLTAAQEPSAALAAQPSEARAPEASEVQSGPVSRDAAATLDGALAEPDASRIPGALAETAEAPNGEPPRTQSAQPSSPAEPIGKVVPLRSAAPDAASGAAGPTGLSRSERHAFREIARALGARVEGEELEAFAEGAETGPGQPPEERVAPEAAEAPPAEPASPGHDPLQERLPEPESYPAPAPEGLAPAPAATAQLPPEPQPAAPAAEQPAQAPVSELARHAELIFDRLPIGVMVSRGDVPIAMNRTLLDLLGYEDIDAFHRESGLEGLFNGRAAESLSPGAEGSTVMLTARDGETIAVDARLQAILWDELPATLMSFRRAVDAETLPKLKAVELDLRRRTADVRELRAILDTATDGVIVLDEAGRILSLNKAAEALFGYDQNEVAGETFITLFAPDSHALALDYLEGLKANGVASVLNDGREVVGRVRQGGRIPLFMTLGAISEAPERKFCAVLRDITPWKKAEGDLLEAKQAAEQASAQKSDFLAKISHEVRTPLSAIIGFAEVMIEERFGPIGNERYLEYLRDIHASGGHVISLINDLLDLSKIEAGKFDLNFVSVDANEIVSRSVAMLQPQASAARVVLRTSLSQRLPRVVADERSLRQIVLNILSNAVKFTDPGGQVIVSTAFTDRGEVALRVRDTGIGMTEKEIETALEPFRQVAGSARGGTGLGLPLTKALVEANRASLTIRSAKDSGTLVEVTFPTTRVLSE